MHAEHTREVGVFHWRAIYSYYIIVYILIHICVHLDTLNNNRCIIYIHTMHSDQLSIVCMDSHNGDRIRIQYSLVKIVCIQHPLVAIWRYSNPWMGGEGGGYISE